MDLDLCIGAVRGTILLLFLVAPSFVLYETLSPKSLALKLAVELKVQKEVHFPPHVSFAFMHMFPLMSVLSDLLVLLTSPTLAFILEWNELSYIVCFWLPWEVEKFSVLIRNRDRASALPMMDAGQCS